MTIENLGTIFREDPIPRRWHWQSKPHPYRDQLVEALADHDDSIMELYLEGKAPDAATLKKAIRAATLKIALIPVIMGSAFP